VNLPIENCIWQERDRWSVADIDDHSGSIPV